MLETWVKKLIPPDDPLWVRADRVVKEIPAKDRQFGHKIDKAYNHTWLAWQEEPGKRMGSAISGRYLRSEAPEAAPFIQWLEALVAPPVPRGTEL